MHHKTRVHQRRRSRRLFPSSKLITCLCDSTVCSVTTQKIWWLQPCVNHTWTSASPISFYHSPKQIMKSAESDRMIHYNVWCCRHFFFCFPTPHANSHILYLKPPWGHLVFTLLCILMLLHTILMGFYSQNNILPRLHQACVPPWSHSASQLVKSSSMKLLSFLARIPTLFSLFSCITMF